jgi:NADH-quinone oxidoreductase subunit N
MNTVADKLEWIKLSLGFFLSESLLVVAILLLIVSSIFLKKISAKKWIDGFVIISFVLSVICNLLHWNNFTSEVSLFSGFISFNRLSLACSVLFDVCGALTVLLSWNSGVSKRIEYYALLLTAVVGAHLLVMSTHWVMVFLSIELISIPSYLLAAFHFNKKGMEAAMKYFLFGSVASAVMLYGMSLLFGITSTLDFTSGDFHNALLKNQSQFLFLTICLVLTGFLYKIASAPMHLWAPDVYESAPTPIVAFFSVVPKVAGVVILTKIYFIINLQGQSFIRWQIVLSMIVFLTLTIGNFGALVQKNPKRMMAYSSIAQAGFLLIGPLAVTLQGIQFMLFYAIVFSISNYLVFYYLEFFERKSITTIKDFKGLGRLYLFPQLALLVGLLSLTGLPPTAGFTAKLLVFSSLWSAYELSSRTLLLVLIAFGLLNTVVSLFFYLKIPYQAFLRETGTTNHIKSAPLENIVGFILVVILVWLFFQPSGLMGWLNSVTFVL